MFRHPFYCFSLIGIYGTLCTYPSMTLGQDADAPIADKTLSTKKVNHPKFLNLRYDEDFSYLDDAAYEYEPDLFDPLKNIDLGNDWNLTLGGEFRFRMESETNKGFGATEPANDTFQLYRYMLHADFKYRKLMRVFVQGVAAFDEDRDLALRGIDENKWDLQQLFVDLRVLGEDLPLTLRVGRQDLSYGNQRFVSPLEWANTRRRFDGVKLFAKGKTWDVDMFFVKPVIVQRKQHDRYNEDFDFYGAYVTYKGIPNHGLDMFAFAINNTNKTVNPNGKVGDTTRYTLGARFWGKHGPLDCEAEIAGQWGTWAGDTIQAWSWTIDGGYTFAEVDWKPRVGVGFDWASGDENAFDGKVGTFDQLFPLGHKYLGFMDLIGRQNVNAVNVNLTAWPIAKKVQARVAYHTFWLNDEHDAIYSAGGGAGRRDIFGNSGREIGHELDLTVALKMDKYQSMLFGYSHFWDSTVIEQTGPSQDANLFYVQYQMKF